MSPERVFPNTNESIGSLSLTIAIADSIISEGFPFNISQKPRFEKVLNLASNVSKTDKPHKRNLIYKELLGGIHEQNTKSNLEMIKNEAEIFRLLFLGHGTTISRCQLLNIMVSGENIPVAVLEKFIVKVV